jgi:aminopeptidase N
MPKTTGNTCPTTEGAEVMSRHSSVPARFGRAAALVALSGLLASCVAPAGGRSSDETRAPIPPATTTTLPPATATDIGDPLAPGLGNGGYDVEEYAVDMTFDPGAITRAKLNIDAAPADPADPPVVLATATITATATQRLTEVVFDFEGADVWKASVDGESARFVQKRAKLFVTPARRVGAGKSFTVEVSYHITPAARRSEVATHDVGWVGSTPGSWHVRSEPDGAHHWLPANDHPSDKAVFHIEVTAAPQMAAVASGDLVEHTKDNRWVWETSDPVPPSSVLVVIAPLEVVEDEAASAETGVTIRHALPPSMAGNRPGALRFVDDMLLELEDKFGAYPFDSFGVVVVDGPTTSFGNHTWAVMTADQLTDNAAELTIIDHLARHWFGDSATPARWSDVWLSTSFARYAQWLWIERDLGNRAGDLAAGTARNSVMDSGWPPPDEPRLGDVFVGSVFIHGAVTLHALRLRMGDGPFFRMMADLYAEHAGGWVSTADMVAAVSAAGTDIRHLYDTWLHGDSLPGFPDR